MAQRRSKSNRGPAAAAENREALLAAARSLFRAHGYDVPLSKIAREAGVGQGVLYRHFPTRLELAFAVFEKNYARYERLARESAPDAFFTLWDEIVRNVIEETAFIDMAIEARRTRDDYDAIERLMEILRPPLQRAIVADLLAPDVTADEVVMAIRMAYGIVRTAGGFADAADLRRTVLRAFPRLAHG